MKFDLTEAARLIIDHKLDESERAELVRELGKAIRYPSRPLQLLVAQIASECVEQPGCTPEITIRIGMIYGALIGILAERDRVSREKRLIA
jgi:hypothetical protein